MDVEEKKEDNHGDTINAPPERSTNMKIEEGNGDEKLCDEDAMEKRRGWKLCSTRKHRIIAASVVLVLVAVGLLVGLLVPKSRRETGGTTEAASKESDRDIGESTDSTTTAAPTANKTIGATTPLLPSSDPWPHDESDIPPDPAVTFGELANGLRYAALSNPEPPGRLSLRLRVSAGSLHEEEDQLGLAHFLEHMMFNGLRNFPDPSDLVTEMQRIGVDWGRHLNAYTTFEETVYQLDLPDADNYTTNLGLTVMRDWADGALLDPDEIQKERGVVLSELALGDTIDWRVILQQLEFLAPDHRITNRMPIGTKEVISTAPRERFLNYYKKFYVPSRITIIAVGDVDVADLDSRIRTAFDSMVEPDGGFASDPDMGDIPSGIGFRAAAFTDEELTYEMVSIDSIRAYESVPDSEAERVRRMRLSLAHSILDQRFDILSREEDSPILVGGVSGPDVWAQSLDWPYIYILPLEGLWEEAVPVLEQEFRRAREHGFTESELREAKANVLDTYEEAVETASSRWSGGLADDIVGSVGGRSVFSSQEEDLRIAEQALEAATPRLVHDAFREYWNKTDLSLLLIAREAPDNAADVLTALYEESKTVVVEPPNEASTSEFGYTDFGLPGTVVSDNTVKDLDIRQLVLSNNVRVNMKRTNFEANSMSMVARFGTGQLGQPQNLTWLDKYAEAVMDEGGFGKHTLTELERILSGRTVSLGFWVSGGSFALSGGAAPDDLELLLQLTAAALSDPGYREPQFRGFIPEILSEFKHTFDGALAHAMAWLWGDDGRFAVPTEEGLTGLEISDIKGWIHDQLIGEYLEVSLVGDFDPEVALLLLLNTLGALPARADTPTEVDSEAREIGFPAVPDSRTFTYETKIAQAAALVVWEVPALLTEDIGLTRRLNILARILDHRMLQRIREDLGDSYSPQAAASISSAFDHGMIFALSPGTPEDTGPVIELIVDLARNISSDATEDELVRAKRPIQTSLEETLRDNSYWLDVIDGSQAKPFQLDWRRERDADYESITLEEIKFLADDYLSPEKSIRIQVLPVAGDATELSSLGSGRALGSIFDIPDLTNIPDLLDTRRNNMVSLDL